MHLFDDPTSPQPAQMSEGERIARLRLIRTENIGPVTFRDLVQRFGTAQAAIDALPDLARRGGRRRPLKVPSALEAEREIAWNHRIGAQILAIGEPDYPLPLAAIEDAPPVISVLGDPRLLSTRSLAIVGARNASMNGRRFSEMLAREIGSYGYTVISGLARGIDGAAHAGSLETGSIAVVAGGIDLIYPPEHDALYREIADRGAVVAEPAIGTTPQAHHFPSRNRIISGLSLGVLVVEAAKRSGSLITARRALDQGREVFAIPGSPLDKRSDGTNRLIQEGAAHLVQGADDVIRILNGLSTPHLEEPSAREFEPPPPLQPDPQALEKERTVILEAIGADPVAVDELIRGCQLSSPIVATVLLEAELAGVIDRHPGNRVSRRLEISE
jgi:DNA processing protein